MAHPAKIHPTMPLAGRTRLDLSGKRPAALLARCAACARWAMKVTRSYRVHGAKALSGGVLAELDRA